MKTLRSLETLTLALTIFLLPLFVLPVFSNIYYPAKVALLVFGVGLWLILKATKTTVRGRLELPRASFDLAVITLAVAYLVSAALVTPNKMEAFFLPGTATVIAISALIYFALNEGISKKIIKASLLVSGTISAVISLLMVADIAKALHLPEFTQTEGFNLIGGTLPLSIFLLILLPLAIGWVVSAKQVVNKVFLAVVTLILAFGFIVSIYYNVSASKRGTVFQSLSTSWGVVIDTLKESPLLGTGPANYLTSFNRFREVGYNQTSLWNTRFSSGQNFYLTVVAETGLLGLVALAILLAAIIKEFSKQPVTFKAETISLVLLLLAGLAFPLSPVLLVLLFVLLSLTTGVKESKVIHPRFPILLISMPMIVVTVVIFYFSAGYLQAEAFFANSLNALKANDGKRTYEEVGKAIKANPYVDRYHITRSQVALALANALAGKKDLTDEERNSVAQLIQQSIAEAKAAVTLNPTRATNWELLAKNYQSIMSFAKGSDQFAIQTYSQAIALDPTNPILRVELGGVYYAQGDYDSAIDTFKLAVLAKQDYANAHYNLAIALREKKEFTKAIEEMQLVLSQVDKNSKDYELAKAELENLEKKKASAQEKTEAETLTQPEKTNTSQAQVELPEDANPPQAPEGVPSLQAE